MRKLLYGGLIAVVLAVGLHSIITRPMPHDLPVRYRVFDSLLKGLFVAGEFTSMLGFGNKFTVVQAMASLLRQLPFFPKPAKDISIKELYIENIRVLMYSPHSAEKTTHPALIYFHGGGFSVGNPEMVHPLTLVLAERLNAVVISVDYHLAPEHVFPRQFDDCYQVVTHVVNNAASYGIDQKRIALAGDSAGGNLAAAVTQSLVSLVKKCAKEPIAGQVLLFPSLQFLDFNLPSMLQNKDQYILTQYDMAMYWSFHLMGNDSLIDTILQGKHSLHLRNTEYAQYLGLENVSEETIKTAKENALQTVPEHVFKALTDPRASPMMAQMEDLKCLPPTFVITAEYDVLSDDGFHYEKRLKKANVDVRHAHYPSVHDFFLVDLLPEPTELCKKMIDDIVTFLEGVFKTAQEK